MITIHRMLTPAKAVCKPRVSQVMKESIASCWSITASPSPARMEPLVSAAWPGPGVTVPKVGSPLSHARTNRVP